MGALTSAAILGPCPHALQHVMSSVMMAMNDDEDRDTASMVGSSSMLNGKLRTDFKNVMCSSEYQRIEVVFR